MPGTRNLARERARLAMTASARYADLHRLLVGELPAADAPLVGYDEIVRYLTDVLRVRRRSGQVVTPRMIKRWTHTAQFPLLRGLYTPKYRRASSPLTTSHCVTAWVLSRASSDERELFTVARDNLPTARG
jgi:hypothetical protein